MTSPRQLKGVYAAAITPLKSDGAIDLDAVPEFMGFLARRGCHGALMLGTTGEGPSFSHNERVALMRAALQVRQEFPDFHLLAGTGTPSLEETFANTKAAFELGFDGVVVLPPYYYRKVTDDGLYSWFDQVIRRSTPAGGALFGYHIPGVTGVPLSIELLARLKEAHPDRFVGVKDSSGSLEHAEQLGQRFQEDLYIMIGHDRVFGPALHSNASGCITAMANICSPYLRRVWEAHCSGVSDPRAQSALEMGRAVMDQYPPAPPLIKAVLSHRYNYPRWSVRPPLQDLPPELEAQAIAGLDAACNV